MSIKPAYHIHLTATQKRLVAELASIQSQIDWLMQLTVKHLLDCNPVTARTIMGSTNVAANAAVWKTVIVESVADEELLGLMAIAMSGIVKLAEDRNNYLHTLFAYASDTDDPEDIDVEFAHEVGHLDRARGQRAVKVRTAKAVDINGLREARDRAARLSLVIAHIEWEVMELDVPSPFRRRLFGQRLLPLPTPPA